ncbi:NADH:flavin oxidoreductase/NADH oxidase family protein [Mycobacteroides abscessus]|uniref:NADH:flavin oxidoreductase/NADH oxidase family protein n=1 Tax=Mycobacteroides abscessus TaxID=36809 RepID=UPI000C2600D7|nr:NADH:flavin oxidoreductase/NADH oxidase family protein [Mycobacteroides abscessus]
MTQLTDQLELPCGQVLPNRLIKSALSEVLANDEHGPDHRLQQLYSTWGSGGFGLLITGNVMIDPDHFGEPGNVALDPDGDLEPYSRWAEAAHRGGSPIWMQLNHPGRQANSLITGKRPVAPSAIAPHLPGLPVPRALTNPQIEEIISRFGRAAAMAESAGFDGVQIHGAHGYLVSQFLSPLSNQRQDSWGGDSERRMRFVLEVVRAIRGSVSSGFAVGIKLNSADFQRGGYTEAESRGVIQRLVQEKVDLIEISGGTYESWAMLGRPATTSRSTKEREAYFLEYAHMVRADVEGVPLVVTGGFRSRVAMARAVADGECDAVGIGRPAALIPDAAQALISGRIDILPTPGISLGVPALTNRIKPLKALEGALDLQWHTEQINLLGSGKATDPCRPAWRTAITAMRRNGIDAFRSKRGSAARSAS